jgi:hypothetical protein
MCSKFHCVQCQHDGSNSLLPHHSGRHQT